MIPNVLQQSPFFTRAVRACLPKELDLLKWAKLSPAMALLCRYAGYAW